MFKPLSLCIVTALTLFGYTSFAQDSFNISSKLSWQDQKESRASSDSQVLSFENAVIDPVFLGLPTSRHEFRINSDHDQASFELSGAEYVSVSEKYFSLNQKRILTTDVQIQARITKGRNQKFVSLAVLPFRLNPNTGDLERLVNYSGNLSLSKKRGAKATRTTVDSSVLGEGTWYKIAVGRDGVYRIDHNLLTELGIEPSEINKQNINIYGNGGELLPFENWEPRPDDLIKNNIFVSGAANETFQQGDFILFYGKGHEKWRLETNDSGPDRFKHINHYYSDSSYYFLRVDDLVPQRIPDVASSTDPQTHVVNKFQDFRVIENDLTNLNKSGRTFYGEHFDINLSYSFTFDIPNVTSDPAVLHMECAARSSGASSSFEANISGSQLQVSPNPTSSGATANVANIDSDFLTFSPSNGDDLGMSVTFSPGVSGAEGWLDFLELNVTRDLRMSGNQMIFRDTSKVLEGNVGLFEISNASLINEVWDITDFTQPMRVEIEAEGDLASFKMATDTIRQYISFTNSNYLVPRAVGSLENQNLHALEDVDMVILSSPLLVAESQEIATIHQEEGMNVEIVTPMQVYNEFSSGNPDVTGIKMFLKHLYEKAEGVESLRPQYLLIMGDGSYSGNKSVNSINSFAVITYQSENSVSPTQSYVSDDYFAFLDPDESEDDKLDIGVGRIPAESNQEATDYINKLQIYISDNTSIDGDAFCLGDEALSPYGPWRNDIVLVADDQDGNGAANESAHMSQSDQHADSIYFKYNDYNVIKLYMDAYQQVTTPGGERYPAGAEAIRQHVQKGALLVQYTGHGGEKGWAHERILDIPSIQNWTNINKLPLFMTATCELARFDDPSFKSAGEVIVMSPTGGAIAMLTTTRIVFSSANHSLAKAFYLTCFEDEADPDLRLGDIGRFTKNHPDVPNSSNKRNFTLLGDPALRLSYPQFDVFTTHMNDVEITEVPDTVKSLQEVSVKGYVGTTDGAVLTDFDGFVYPTVYDKRSEILTLDNDEGGLNYEFHTFKNVIYKGKASVVDGEFEFTFIIPKDINYNFGEGRISYYAVSGSVDAHGHSEEFIIGGSLDNVELNAIGPDINLFLNDTTFVYGGITDENPLILAKVFDENGINTVGNGIGHDITATIDEQTDEQIVLNDFYEADLDTYQSGDVRYQLTGLSEGTHNLKVKVWDVHNNSSEAYTEFVVASSSGLALEHVLNYPNPFTTRTEFFFEHNQACDVLDVRIQVFTIGGKVVKTIDRVVHSDGFRSAPIEWDGKDDFGDKIGKGVYVYRVHVQTPEGMKAEQFEKLVILN
jgi:hypothetical protein